MNENLHRRSGQVLSVLRQEGIRGIATRLTRRAYAHLGAAELEFPLLPADIVSSAEVQLPACRPVSRTRKLRVAWLATPPAGGSGGHTTMFRMVEALESVGHACSLYLYDRHGSSAQSHESVIRSHWPSVAARVYDASGSLDGYDVLIATSWETAHVLATKEAAQGRRMYFIQDYEPFFKARGALYALAEDTYKFGFECIALGNMVSDCLKEGLGIKSSIVPFGCDTDVYRLTNRGARKGVVFYTKPEVPRRGYHLAELALAKFHAEHPDQPIHVYGERVRSLPFPVIEHGRLDPSGLNRLYNETIAGMAMSFTNISLVAEEMLAAGNIPVVNDSSFARADLDHPMVAWANPNPFDVAKTLSDVVKNHTNQGSVDASMQVRQGWKHPREEMVRVVEASAYGT